MFLAVAVLQLKDFFATDVAYALEMGTHPQALYRIADSPIGLAAWLLDHDATSLALIARVFDGQAEGLTRDDILDNITHYWLTNTGVSSGRLYRETVVELLHVPLLGGGDRVAELRATRSFPRSRRESAPFGLQPSIAPLRPPTTLAPRAKCGVDLAEAAAGY